MMANILCFEQMCAIALFELGSLVCGKSKTVWPARGS